MSNNSYALPVVVGDVQEYDCYQFGDVTPLGQYVRPGDPAATFQLNGHTIMITDIDKKSSSVCQMAFRIDGGSQIVVENGEWWFSPENDIVLLLADFELVEGPPEEDTSYGVYVQGAEPSGDLTATPRDVVAVAGTNAVFQIEAADHAWDLWTAVSIDHGDGAAVVNTWTRTYEEINGNDYQRRLTLTVPEAAASGLYEFWVQTQPDDENGDPLVFYQRMTVEVKAPADIAISSLSDLSGEVLRCGELVPVSLDLADIGGIDAPDVTVLLTVSGPEGYAYSRAETIPLLQTGAAAETLVIDWDTAGAVAGVYTVTVSAGGALHESDYTNNSDNTEATLIPPPQLITVTAHPPDAAEYSQGETVAISAIVTDPDTTAVTDATATAAISSEGESVATVALVYNGGSGEYEGEFLPSDTGTYSVEVSAARVGYSTGTSTPVEFTVVNAPPDTEILTTIPAPDETIGSAAVTFSWSGTDTGTLVQDLAYAWKLDNGAWSDYASATSFELTGLTDGPHTFSVKANDGDLDDPIPASRSFNVDLTAPGIAAVTPSGASAHPDGSFENGSIVTVTVTAAANETGLVGSLSVAAAAGTSVVPGVALTPVGDGTYTYAWNTAGLPPATYLVSLRLRDPAGNETVQADALAITLTDTTAPQVAAVLPNFGDDTDDEYEIPATVTITVIEQNWEPDLTGTVTITSVDRRGTVLDAAPLVYDEEEGVYGYDWTTAGLTAGDYRVEITLTDASNNTDADGLAPDADLIVALTPAIAPTVQFTDPEDGADGISLETSIMIGFSEPMAPDSVAAAFSIAPSVPGELLWDGNEVEFRPTTFLSRLQTYTCTVGTGATDLPGNGLTAPYEFSFMVGEYASGPVIYVDCDATGTGDGNSWPNALRDLQAALFAADPGQDIWVAEGTYYPTWTTRRDISFQMKEGVDMYGGFAGWEGDRDQRDWDTYETILSGDIGTRGTNADNSNIVVVGADNGALDGFELTGGKGDLHDSGGGMWNSNCSPTVANCTFSGNSSGYGGVGTGGGGMGNSDASPTVVSCLFIGNSTAGYGGGMWNRSSAPAVVDCTFEANSAMCEGGGMYNNTSSPGVRNCTFVGNHAGWVDGGGMQNVYSSPTVVGCTFSSNSANYGGGMNNTYSCPLVADCLFLANSAPYVGGGMYNYSSSPTITNCLFTRNTGGRGGGMCNSSYSSPRIANCIFSANSADSGGAVYNYHAPPYTISNCVFSTNTPNEVGAASYYVDMTISHSCVQGGVEAPTLALGTPSFSGPVVSFSGSASDDGGVTEVSYELSGATVANGKADGISFWSFGPLSLGVGSTYVAITAEDAAGNWDLWRTHIYTDANGQSTAVSTARIGRHSVNICVRDGGGNIEGGDPLFVDPANGDFRLQPGSPCIDTGTADGAPDTDILGNTRPMGAGYDMGAYEYGATDQTAPVVAAVSSSVGADQNNAYETGATVTIEVQAEDYEQELTGTVTIRTGVGAVVVDAAALTPTGYGVYTYGWDTAGLDPGSYTVETTLSDASGNTDSDGLPETPDLTIALSDTTPPVVAAVTSAVGDDTDNEYETGSVVTLTVTEANAETGLTGNIHIVSLVGGLVVNVEPLTDNDDGTYGYVWDTAGLPPADDYQVEVALHDASGNIDPDGMNAPKDLIVSLVDTTPPEVTSVTSSVGVDTDNMYEFGQTVRITVTEAHAETGLTGVVTISSPTFGLITASALVDQLDGTYVYDWNTAGRPVGTDYHIEITLEDACDNADPDGLPATPDLTIALTDETPPVVATVTSAVGTDTDNTYRVTDSVLITVAEQNGEPGLTGTITIASPTAGTVVDAAALLDNDDGTYAFSWDTAALTAADNYGVEVTLTDSSGNTDTDGLPTTPDLTITLLPEPRPDLVVTAIAAPSNPEPGSTVTFVVTVVNLGDLDAGPFSVGLWLNRAQAPQVGDAPDYEHPPIGGFALTPGTTMEFLIEVIAPAPGSYTAWAYVDRENGTGAVAESNETNNVGPAGGYAWAITTGDWTGSEGFETGWGGWTTSTTVWEIGTPSVGPFFAYEGASCAGINLTGDPEFTGDGALLSPTIDVPAASAGRDGLPSEQILLVFRVWAREVDWWVGVATTDAPEDWQYLANSHGSSPTNEWARAAVDLTPFAGRTVRLQFFAQSWEPGGVFLLDDIGLERSSLATIHLAQSFEDNWDGWYSTTGQSEIGIPANGVGGHDGDQSVGINLAAAGGFDGYETLFSPIIEVPNLTAGEQLQLSFWTHLTGQATCWVRVAEWSDGGWEPYEAWEHLANAWWQTGATGWRRLGGDLTGYSGGRIRLAFDLQAHDDGHLAQALLDDVRILVPAVSPSTVTHGFDDDAGGWFAQSVDVAIGPALGTITPRTGTGCVVVNDEGQADFEGAYVLESPVIELASLGAGRGENEGLWVGFWHWGHGGRWMLAVTEWTGEQWSEWLPLAGGPARTEEWRPAQTDLTAFAGELIRLRFEFSTTEPGGQWALDDLAFDDTGTVRDRFMFDLSASVLDFGGIPGPTALDPIVFGMVSEATDVFDEQLDAAASPLPGSPKPFVHLVDDVSSLARDIREVKRQDSWLLEVNAPADGAVVLNWNTDSLPSCGLYAREILTDGSREENGLEFYLGETDSLEVPAGTTLLLELVNNQGPFDLSLEPGWSLISLPGDPVDPDNAMSALSAIVLGRIWHWQDRRYRVATHIEAFKGYWVYVSRNRVREARTLRLELRGASDAPILLPGHWSLVGPAASPPFSTLDIPIANGATGSHLALIWAWDALSRRYRAGDDEIAPGCGYWFYLPEPCRLRLKGQ